MMPLPVCPYSALYMFAMMLNSWTALNDGHVSDVVAAHLSIVCSAVEHVLGGRVAAAVNGPLGDGAVVEGALPDCGAVEIDAGHHGAEHKRVARVERHFRDLLFGDHTAAPRTLRLQREGLRGDLHSFAHRTDFQADIEAERFGGFQHHTVPDKRLESGGGGGEGVGARA